MWIVTLVAVLCLGWTVYRDVQIEKIYPSDLRNRVVASRLQKDGKLPYFYKWKPEDGIRYYDPQNFDTLKVSTSTASPFFHELMYPIVELEQRTISRLWVFIQYVLLVIMAGVSIRLAKAKLQKASVIALGTAFLFTEAWINLIAPGQNYLFIPFFALLFYYFLQKKDSLLFAFLAGISAVSLVLIRPNTVLFFVPFLLLVNKYTMRFIIVFFVPVILVLGYIIGSPFQRALWKDYAEGVSEQLKIHLENGEAARQINGKDPGFVKWEGWDMEEVAAEEARTRYRNYSENGNFFVLVKNSLGIRLSPSVLAISSLSLIVVFLLLYYLNYRKTDFAIYNVAILGFCLYMIADLFSPIYRHQYYTVQWFFPLFLAAAGIEKRYLKIYMILIAGIILNIINTPFIKMEHTIGEYLILGALLLLAFVYKGTNNLKLIGRT